MACSICKQPKHDKRNCNNQKQAFLDKYEDRWEELHQYLVDAVQEAIKPIVGTNDIWSTIMDPLDSWYDLICSKVQYGVKCSPLEMAVWRYDRISNIFWRPIKGGSGLPGHGLAARNDIYEYMTSASDSEKDTYFKLRKITWDQVYAELQVAKT